MRTILTWVLSGLLALVFLGAGLTKLTSQPMMVHEFASFGLPLWFMYVTGIIELSSAVLILVPRLTWIGASLLVCTMAGALFTHLTHGQAALAGVPAVLLLLALAVGTLRGWGGLPALASGRVQPMSAGYTVAHACAEILTAHADFVTNERLSA